MVSVNKLTPYLGIIIVLVLGYFGGWWDNIFVRPTNTTSLKPAVPSIDLSQTKLTGWDKGKKSWEIEAHRIWQSADGNFVYFQTITHGVAYSVNDKRVDFTAGWARWEKIPELLYFGGKLATKIDNGTMDTEEAVLNYQSEELKSTTPVYMNQKDICARANSMRIDISKEKTYLEGDVVLIQKNSQVTAEGMIFNQKDETYQLIGPKGVTINP